MSIDRDELPSGHYKVATLQEAEDVVVYLGGKGANWSGKLTNVEKLFNRGHIWVEVDPSTNDVKMRSNPSRIYAVNMDTTLTLPKTDTFPVGHYKVGTLEEMDSVIDYLVSEGATNGPQLSNKESFDQGLHIVHVRSCGRIYVASELWQICCDNRKTQLPLPAVAPKEVHAYDTNKLRSLIITGFKWNSTSRGSSHWIGLRKKLTEGQELTLGDISSMREVLVEEGINKYNEQWDEFVSFVNKHFPKEPSLESGASIALVSDSGTSFVPGSGLKFDGALTDGETAMVKKCLSEKWEGPTMFALPPKRKTINLSELI